jgi:hypothetical protein
MIMKNSILIIIALALMGGAFISCEDENLNDLAFNQFVVEAFLFADEPVDDIRLKTVFPLTDEVDTSEPINNAEVILSRGAEQFPLVSSGSDGFYHYPGDDLEVRTGDVFRLEITHDGITATAETQVPTPTQGLMLSQDSIIVPTLPLRQGRDAVVEAIGNFLRESSVTASWDNPNGEQFYMVVENVTEATDPIFPQQVLDALEDLRFVSEPTDDDELVFLGGSLITFGTYSVSVFHVNEEYAALFDNTTQDSRDLNEPPSNVVNALGIFSAFNSQTAFFEVVREE